MLETRQVITLVSAAIGAGLLFLFHRQIAEAISNFRGGGPRPPSHPLPGMDLRVVRRVKNRISG